MSSAFTSTAILHTSCVWVCSALTSSSLSVLHRRSGCTLAWYNISSVLHASATSTYAVAIRTCDPIPNTRAERLIEEEGLNGTAPSENLGLEVLRARHRQYGVEAKRRDRRFCERRAHHPNAAQAARVEECDLCRLGCGGIMKMQDKLRSTLYVRQECCNAILDIPS